MLFAGLCPIPISLLVDNLSNTRKRIWALIPSEESKSAALIDTCIQVETE